MKQTREKAACRESNRDYMNQICEFFSRDHQFNQTTNYSSRRDFARFATMLKTIDNSIDRVSKDIKRTINRLYSKFCSNSIFDADFSFIHTSWIDSSSDRHDQSMWNKEDNSKHRSNWIRVDSFKKKERRQS